MYLTRPGLSCSMWTLSPSMWDLVSWPGMELRPPALGAWSLSHWTAGEVIKGPFVEASCAWGSQTIFLAPHHVWPSSRDCCLYCERWASRSLQRLFLALQCSMQHLTSLTRDRTCIGSTILDIGPPGKSQGLLFLWTIAHIFSGGHLPFHCGQLGFTSCQEPCLMSQSQHTPPLDVWNLLSLIPSWQLALRIAKSPVSCSSLPLVSELVEDKDQVSSVILSSGAMKWGHQSLSRQGWVRAEMLCL